MTAIAPVRWIDCEYRVPAAGDTTATGAQEWARNTFDRIARWGHTVTEETYIEEEGADEHGRRFYGVRAIRFECTVDGRHRVVLRHDSETVTPDNWSVTVDGVPQQLPSLAGQMWWRKLAALALTTHRAAELAAARRAA
ncbi:hypothetical protein ABZY68_25665 [Streptomyces sp. NPDC006482]|uniref:hypothetical protein n=1 Tax=Streptomyces sp. NPDC006482 TaxID=3154306 RepID=UPI0033AC75F1